MRASAAPLKQAEPTARSMVACWTVRYMTFESPGQSQKNGWTPVDRSESRSAKHPESDVLLLSRCGSWLLDSKAYFFMHAGSRCQTTNHKKWTQPRF